MRVVSHQALDQYMRARRITNHQLANLIGDPAKRATISHVRSGARRTLRDDIATAIEAALNAPAGFFFMPDTANTQTTSSDRGAA